MWNAKPYSTQFNSSWPLKTVLNRLSIHYVIFNRFVKLSSEKQQWRRPVDVRCGGGDGRLTLLCSGASDGCISRVRDLPDCQRRRSTNDVNTTSAAGHLISLHNSQMRSRTTFLHVTWNVADNLTPMSQDKKPRPYQQTVESASVTFQCQLKFSKVFDVRQSLWSNFAESYKTQKTMGPFFSKSD